jgi:uncharacterized protein YjlB
MITITVQSLAVLERIVARTGLSGVWVQLTRNHRQFRAETGEILNWWESTGTVLFQGQNPDRFEFIFMESITDDMPGIKPMWLRNAA